MSHIVEYCRWQNWMAAYLGYTPRMKTLFRGWPVMVHDTHTTSLGNSGLCWTIFAHNRDTAVPSEGNGDLQTLICVLVARPRRCLTLLNTVPDKIEWRLISATLRGWRRCFVADQLWFMTRIREEEDWFHASFAAIYVWLRSAFLLRVSSLSRSITCSQP